MSNIKFKGIMPALITPYDHMRNLNTKAVSELLDFQYAAGVTGFYVNGATGEGPVLSPVMRMDMIEAVMDVNRNRGLIINHIGSPNYFDAVALVKHSNTTGVDALASLAPNYFFNYNDDELVDYYKSIAAETDLPLLVYATPMIKSDDIVSLMGRIMEIPNVIGLKFTRNNYFELSLIKQLNGGDINVINGPDEMLICGLSVGADGGIGSTYNLIPDLFVSLYNSFTAGNIDEARAYQYKINRIIDVLLKFGGGNIVKSVKEGLTFKGFDVGRAAYPASGYSDDESSSLRKALVAAGLDI